MKVIVSVIPSPGLMSVHKYAWLAHSPFEPEEGPLSPVKQTGREFPAIPSLPDIGKRARSARLFGSDPFIVLRDRHYLLIDLLVERSIDGPVMRNRNGLPASVVELGSLCICEIAPTEPPPVPKFNDVPWLADDRHRHPQHDHQ